MNEIKRLGKANYDEIFSLSQFAFQYELKEEEFIKKENEASRHSIWGWMDGDKLAAKLHIIPLTSYVNGKSFEMGGISSVATWPEYRRQGIIKHLLFHALKEMKHNGQTISFLAPFSIPFYRKYGWELAFTHKEYDIPIGHFKRNWEAKGYVRRIKQDIPLLDDMYTIYAKRLTGMLARDAEWWEQRVLTDAAHIAVAYNEADVAEGYLIYNVKENICTVKEIAYTSLNGRKLLLQFIANHDSMASKVKMTVPENDNLTLLLDDPTFEQKIVPYFMARIVDVFAFLKQYPFQQATGEAQSLVIYVEDTFFSENSGAYQLASSEAVVDVEKVSQERSGIHCTVQLLASMFLGYKRPLELYNAGLIQGEIGDVERLEALIPEQQTFFADFF